MRSPRKWRDPLRRKRSGAPTHSTKSWRGGVLPTRAASPRRTSCGTRIRAARIRPRRSAAARAPPSSGRASQMRTAVSTHRVAGVTAESERGSAEVRCHGMQSMSGTTAIVSVTSRSGPHAMIIASTGSSRKGGSADDARPALYCGHSHPVMVDWHAPPRSHSHGVTAHSSCGSAPSAQSCAHEALADEVAAPIVRRRRDLLKTSQVKSKAPKLCELCPVKGTRLASY